MSARHTPEGAQEKKIGVDTIPKTLFVRGKVGQGDDLIHVQIALIREPEQRRDMKYERLDQHELNMLGHQTVG